MTRPKNANGGKGNYSVTRLQFEKAFTCCGSCFAGAAVSIEGRKYSGNRFARHFFRFYALEVIACGKIKSLRGRSVLGGC